MFYLAWDRKHSRTVCCDVNHYTANMLLCNLCEKHHQQQLLVDHPNTQTPKPLLSNYTVSKQKYRIEEVKFSSAARLCIKHAPDVGPKFCYKKFADFYLKDL